MTIRLEDRINCKIPQCPNYAHRHKYVCSNCFSLASTAARRRFSFALRYGRDYDLAMKDHVCKNAIENLIDSIKSVKTQMDFWEKKGR